MPFQADVWKRKQAVGRSGGSAERLIVELKPALIASVMRITESLDAPGVS